MSGCEAAYLLLVQLEGGLDQIPQGCELLLLLILSLFDLHTEDAKMEEKHLQLFLTVSLRGTCT